MDRNTKSHDQQGRGVPVALRKESVDRNDAICADHHKRRFVALRKESVDRNFWLSIAFLSITCRSPQGERG